MRRRGFTLVELLVVVAVIALLVSILLPSLAGARRRGRALVCMSNMRQLGVAAHMYAGAYKGVLIDYGLAHGGSINLDTTWFNTLRRDYHDRLVARCPEDRSIYWDEFYPGTSQKRRVSYALNDYVTGRVSGYERFRRIDSIRRPATTILFCEMAQQGEYAVSDHVHALNWALDPVRESRKELETKLHVDRSNYSFIDSHVEPCTFEQTFSIKSRRRVGPTLVFEWHHNFYDPGLAY